MSIVVLVYDASGAKIKEDSASAFGYLQYVSNFLDKELHLKGSAHALGANLLNGKQIRALLFEDEMLDMQDTLLIVENATDESVMELYDDLLDQVIAVFGINQTLESFPVKVVKILDHHALVMEGTSAIIRSVLISVLATDGKKTQTVH